jgi:hypothetical protein
MNSYDRLIVRFVIIFFISVAFVTSDVTINTPIGKIATGARIQISWDITDSAPTLLGSLRIQNKNSGESTTINDQLDLTLRKLQWKVNVQPGTYIFAINDGSGEKFSGEFQVAQGTPVGSGNAGGGNVGKKSDDNKGVNQVNNDKAKTHDNSKSVGQKSSITFTPTPSHDLPKSQGPKSPSAPTNSVQSARKSDAVMMNPKAGMLLSLGAIVTFIMQIF